MTVAGLSQSRARSSELVRSLIGLPYATGAMGPDAYDCWGLTRHVQEQLFGRSMPSISSPPTNLRELMAFVKHSPARAQWLQRPSGVLPQHGNLVEMAHGKHPFHIGTWLDFDGGGVLHSLANVGVCWDRVLTLQAAGWRGFTYHDWAGDTNTA